VLNVLQVITNMLVPSLATPPVTPNSAAHGCPRPCTNVNRIVYVSAHNPAMEFAAITDEARVSHVNNPVHKSETAPAVPVVLK